MMHISEHDSEIVGIIFVIFQVGQGERGAKSSVCRVGASGLTRTLNVLSLVI